MKKGHKLTFFLFILYRLSSVLIVQTSYAPDEYWQSLEVAHGMAFGYGYLTWEWKYGLRSYLHPFFFYIFYKIAEILNFDFPSVIITLPRILQALFTALSDQFFFLWCQNFGIQDHWIKVSIFTNWFWYYCGMRTIINTFETCLTIMALYYYPWSIFINETKENKRHQLPWVEIEKKSFKCLIFAFGNCLVRPSAATIWGPFILLQMLFLDSKHVLKFILNCALPALCLTISVSLLIDCLWYDKFMFPAYNFLFFNIFKGISSFYGTHSFHWYATQGLPVVLGLKYFSFIVGLISFLWKEVTKTKNQFSKIFIIITCVLIFNIIVLSYIPHKEFRFALPLIPLMMLIAIKFESDFFLKRRRWKLLWTLLLSLGFVIPTILFGILHQRGTLTLMKYLRSEIDHCNSNCSFLFLMPCHSTPLYSHLHVNVSTKFLQCEPPLTKNHYDESENFFTDPYKWLNHNWYSNKFPSHVVFFDTIESSVISFLKGKGFAKKHEIFHTVFAKKKFGRYILVYGH